MHVLCGIEREAAGVCEIASDLALVPRTVRLSGVLNHDQVLLLRDVVDLVHPSRVSVKMYWHDRLRLAVNSALQLRGVEVEVVLGDISESRKSSKGNV